MRGEAEQNCFDLVKQKLNNDIYFAMSFEDEEIIKKAFSKANANPILSQFPDFIFDDGFIEHFQVTSSYETKRKGSNMEIEKSVISREFQKKEVEASQNTVEGQITFQSIATEPFIHKTHSYANFQKSFEENFDSHIDSLNKYTGNIDHKIFMIEYSDSVLRMAKKYPKDILQKVSYGDLFVRENPTYRISRDINILKCIYDKRELIDYVIFVNDSDINHVRIDIINSRNALEITKLLYGGYEVHCAIVASSQVGVSVSVPPKLE